MTEGEQKNARDLELELAWFVQVLKARFESYFNQDGETVAGEPPPPPDLDESESEYARFVNGHQLAFDERLALVLALVPDMRPSLLDPFFTKNRVFDRRFTEFGGVFHESGHFQPTGETLAFILGGVDVTARFRVQRILHPEHVLMNADVLRLGPTPRKQWPLLKTPLSLTDRYLLQFTTGQTQRVAFSADFPAQHLDTALSWSDLVLHPKTRDELEDIRIWLKHGATLMSEWGMAPRLRPGYRSLFFGPPGTGKTMTACLLGKATGRDVYRIDLATVVSKYIGETEKNLARVFDRAQSRGWILFFDEADALFGKRSQTRDAHDRYANQEIAFLLQRIEIFDGVAILASNMRDNLDEAFTRRFESIIYFPIPSADERLRIWQAGFSAQGVLDPALDLHQVAREHLLSGGAIMNVIRYASMRSLASGGTHIRASDVLTGIRREYVKERKAS